MNRLAARQRYDGQGYRLFSMPTRQHSHTGRLPGFFNMQEETNPCLQHQIPSHQAANPNQ